MPRPEYEDSAADQAPQETEVDSPQSSVDYSQFGTQGGQSFGMIQESATGSVFATRDESDDKA